MLGPPHHSRKRAALVSLLWLLLALLPAGCLEQFQSTRIPSGALQNFLIHLQAGEVDDARAYFAPGLVTPTAQLDASLIAASKRLQRYEIRRGESRSEELEAGEIRETIAGAARPKPTPGSPTPAADEGWQETDIITARMVIRGPGWRILDYELLCCPASE